jgi:isocitrate lyase
MLRLNTTQRISCLARTARAMSALPALPLQPPSLGEEVAEFEQRTNEMVQFCAQSRFKGIKRPYSPSSVASKQGFLPVTPLPSSLLADKLFALFTQRASEGKPVHTMGAIDPVQMTQMARNQEVVYVSGWAASSVLTTGNNEVGPDLGLVSAK